MTSDHHPVDLPRYTSSMCPYEIELKFAKLGNFLKKYFFFHKLAVIFYTLLAEKCSKTTEIFKMIVENPSHHKWLKPFVSDNVGLVSWLGGAFCTIIHYTVKFNFKLMNLSCIYLGTDLENYLFLPTITTITLWCFNFNIALILEAKILMQFWTGFLHKYSIKFILYKK